MDPYGKAEFGLVILPCADKFMHPRLVYARPGTWRNVTKGPTWPIRPRTSHSSALLLAWSGFNSLRIWQTVQCRFTVSPLIHTHDGLLKHGRIFTASDFALDKLRGNPAFYPLYSKILCPQFL